MSPHPDSNVTEDFQQYRLLLRHIWNSFFWADAEIRGWDLVDKFTEVRPALNDSLLMTKLRMKFDVDESKRFRLLVVPTARDADGNRGAPIRISETAAASVSRDWNCPPNYIYESDAVLTFIEFFDFGVCSYRDFRSLLVMIDASAKYPHLVGRQAIIDMDYAEVYISWEQQPGVAGGGQVDDGVDLPMG